MPGPRCGEVLSVCVSAGGVGAATVDVLASSALSPAALGFRVVDGVGRGL